MHACSHNSQFQISQANAVLIERNFHATIAHETRSLCGNDLRSECITNLDYVGDKTDRKSVTRLIEKLNGMMISQDAKIHRTVALSTAKAEFVEASTSAKEEMRIRQLFSEMVLR